jgi:superfamily I DNA and/or RNA helicase
MEEEAQKFLEAEETAQNLVKTLKQLHIEATSYQTATKELDIVRQRLIGLIESTEKIASGSYEIIKILKEIGGPEILSRLTKLENKVSEESTKQSKSLQNLKIFIIVTLISSVIAIIVGIIALLI